MWKSDAEGVEDEAAVLNVVEGSDASSELTVFANQAERDLIFQSEDDRRAYRWERRCRIASEWFGKWLQWRS